MTSWAGASLWAIATSLGVAAEGPERSADIRVRLRIADDAVAGTSESVRDVQAILHEEVPFAAQGGSVQGHLKRKQLQGPTPNQYVTDITWNVYDWAWV